MNAEDSTPSLPTEKLTLTDHLRRLMVPIIDPIVTVLAKLGLSPDVLTVLGFLFHFLFAYLIAIGEFRWAAVAIAVLSPLDALDGSLARKLGHTQGGFGAFLDSSMDRIAEIVLFGGFILYYVAQGDTVMLGIAYAAITGSLMVSYARARAEALGLSAKIGVLGRVERYLLLTATLFFLVPEWGLGILAIMTYFTFGQRMWYVYRQTSGADAP
jgi:CDP-diacylglycerol--glycerol-3-phosphate 3-phosphatidyltransferase